MFVFRTDHNVLKTPRSIKKMLRGFTCIMSAKAMYVEYAYLHNHLLAVVDETKPFLVTFLGILLHSQ